MERLMGLAATVGAVILFFVLKVGKNEGIEEIPKVIGNVDHFFFHDENVLHRPPPHFFPVNPASNFSSNSLLDREAAYLHELNETSPRSDGTSWTLTEEQRQKLSQIEHGYEDLSAMPVLQEKMRQQTIRNILLADKNNQGEIVKAVKPIYLFPDTEGQSFHNIFGNDQVFTAREKDQLKELKIQVPPPTFGIKALEARLLAALSTDLNLVVAHNAGDSQTIVIALPNGDRLTMVDLSNWAKAHNRKVVVLCCYAEHLGVDSELSLKTAVEISENFSASRSKAPAFVGEEVERLKEICFTTVRNNNLNKITYVVMAGGVTTVYAIYKEAFDFDRKKV